MKALTDLLTRYIAHFMAVGTIAIISAFLSFVVLQGKTDASQDAKLQALDAQIALIRGENREDHKAILSRVDLLVSRQK